MTTTVKRLERLLDEKDEALEELQDQVDLLKRQLENGPGWALPREMPDTYPELPLPRLEMEWQPSKDRGWSSYVVEYRLVYRHLCNQLMVVPLGRTKIDGGSGRSPFERHPVDGPEPVGADRALPFRDGAHIMHDAAHLGLPAYALTPSGAERIDQSANYQRQRELGSEHRRTGEP